MHLWLQMPMYLLFRVGVQCTRTSTCTHTRTRCTCCARLGVCLVMLSHSPVPNRTCASVSEAVEQHQFYVRQLLEQVAVFSACIIIQWQIYIVKFWTHTPWRNFLYFHVVFRKKFGQVIGWRLPSSAWEILDLPLISLEPKFQKLFFLRDWVFFFA